MDGNTAFGALSVLLFFFVPGYLLVRVLWPEWRLRGEKALERTLTTVALALVLSLALTILVGFVLGNAGLFYASASDPLLEAILAVLSLVLFGIGWWRGAFARTPPQPSPLAEAPLAGEEDAEEFTARWEEFARDERRLRHEIRVAGNKAPADAERARKALDDLLERRRSFERAREDSLRS